MKYRLFLFLGLVLICSCKKIIEINFPKTEPKIVVNCIFNPDSIFKLNVSKSSDFDDSCIVFLDDAICKLYKNDSLLFEFENIGDGFYIAPNNYKPLSGFRYRLEIFHNNLPSVWAEDSIPQNTNTIELISCIDSSEYTLNGTPLTKLTFNLSDKHRIINYYEISILFRVDTFPYYLTDTNFINTYKSQIGYIGKTSLTTSDVLLNNENVNNNSKNFFPFSDKLFNEQTVQLSLNMTSIYFGYNEILIQPLSTFFIKFKNISENYYKYKKKLILHTENQSSDFWTGTGEPIQMFSNINGGYGIFAGYSEIIDSIKNY